jgi:RNA polymerase sigma-70 factor, ECF subfamily
VELLPRLRRLAWAIVTDRQDADDLLQLTVERALMRSDAWSAGTRLDLWMFKIMKNLWIDELRTRNRWSRVMKPLPEEEPGDEGATADGVHLKVELEQVKNLVEALPEAQRLAVKLVLLGGHTYSEAAAILEIPENTLATRLARGRTALLEHYRSEGTSH